MKSRPRLIDASLLAVSRALVIDKDVASNTFGVQYSKPLGAGTNFIIPETPKLSHYRTIEVIDTSKGKLYTVLSVQNWSDASVLGFGLSNYQRKGELKMDLDIIKGGEPPKKKKGKKKAAAKKAAPKKAAKKKAAKKK